MERVIGAVCCAAGGIQVQRKNGQGRKRLPLPGLAKQDKTDVGINRAGRAHDIGIQFARIEDDRAVVHLKATVERQAGLPRAAGCQFDRLVCRFGLIDGTGQFFRER